MNRQVPIVVLRFGTVADYECAVIIAVPGYQRFLLGTIPSIHRSAETGKTKR